MENLCNFNQCRQVCLHGIVDRTGTFTTAKDQQDGALIGQVQGLAGSLASPALQIGTRWVAGQNNTLGVLEITERILSGNSNPIGKAGDGIQCQPWLDIRHIQQAGIFQPASAIGTAT